MSHTEEPCTLIRLALGPDCMDRSEFRLGRKRNHNRPLRRKIRHISNHKNALKSLVNVVQYLGICIIYVYIICILYTYIYIYIYTHTFCSTKKLGFLKHMKNDQSWNTSGFQTLWMQRPATALCHLDVRHLELEMLPSKETCDFWFKNLSPCLERKKNTQHLAAPNLWVSVWVHRIRDHIQDCFFCIHRCMESYHQVPNYICRFHTCGYGWVAF